MDDLIEDINLDILFHSCVALEGEFNIHTMDMYESRYERRKEKDAFKTFNRMFNHICHIIDIREINNYLDHPNGYKDYFEMILSKRCLESIKHFLSFDEKLSSGQDLYTNNLSEENLIIREELYNNLDFYHKQKREIEESDDFRERVDGLINIMYIYEKIVKVSKNVHRLVHLHNVLWRYIMITALKVFGGHYGEKMYEEKIKAVFSDDKLVKTYSKRFIRFFN